MSSPIGSVRPLSLRTLVSGRLRGPFNKADDDVVGVTVEVAAGPVIPRRHAGVAVSRGDLHISQGNTGVQAGGDEGVAANED